MSEEIELIVETDDVDLLVDMIRRELDNVNTMYDVKRMAELLEYMVARCDESDYHTWTGE